MVLYKCKITKRLYMDLSIQKMNLFNIPSFRGVEQTPAVQPQVSKGVEKTQPTTGNPFATAVSNSNMFQGATAGVNTNIGIGEKSYAAGQCGYKDAVCHTIAFA